MMGTNGRMRKRKRRRRRRNLWMTTCRVQPPVRGGLLLDRSAGVYWRKVKRKHGAQTPGGRASTTS
jgi:hypothetical protein